VARRADHDRPHTEEDLQLKGAVRLRVLVVAALAATLPLAGAMPAGASGGAGSGGAGSAPAPALDWGDCAGGFQCATANVPLDYDAPSGRAISLALIRLPASDPAHRIGSLFVNFGGPGRSGLQRLRERAEWAWLFSPQLRQRFDLVSWDTRGVGQSTGVRCFATGDEESAFFADYPVFPVGAAQERSFYAKAADFARRCRQRDADLLDHMSTADTARDLDLLRRAVGDAKLSYLGLSYGTHVGATYANLFPGKVRAMVLDGALDFVGNAVGHGTDGHTKPIDTRQDVPRGIAETFGAFLTDCTAAGPRCAFSGGDPAAKWAALTARARQAPIVLADGTVYSYASIIGLVNDNLVREQFWPDLAATLQQLSDAPAGAVARRAATPARSDESTVSTVDDGYDNSTDAFYAIQCADSDVPRDPRIYSRLAVTEEQRVPYFGPVGVFDMMPCAFWPPSTDRYTGPWNRPTAAPILVTNNRYDPSTPLHGARDATAELTNARLLVIDGGGHTGMYVPSTCGEQAKREYLFSGVLPPETTACAADKRPFD
jgi:pimeloyl-ACP methyl ester carboxylesterase